MTFLTKLLRSILSARRKLNGQTTRRSLFWWLMVNRWSTHQVLNIGNILEWDCNKYGFFKILDSSWLLRIVPVYLCSVLLCNFKVGALFVQQSLITCPKRYVMSSRMTVFLMLVKKKIGEGMLNFIDYLFIIWAL